MALHVLRKVTPETIAELHDARNPRLSQLYLDADKPWFAQGYVQADAPRAQAITDSIMEGTTGFAVWADEEGLVRAFPDYASAAAAVAGARMTLSIQYEVPTDEAEDEAVEAPKARARGADGRFGAGAAAS